MPKTVRDVLRAIIALASWPEGRARVSMATLAAELGESVRNARRKVKEAGNPPKGLGLLEQTANTGGRSNVSEFCPRWDAIASLPPSSYADHKPGHLRPGFEDANPDTCAPLSTQEPGHWRPRFGIGNPDTGAQKGGACAPRSYLHDLHHHQERPQGGEATPPATDAGGGDSLEGAGGFDGDLAGAIEALAALGVNGAADLARQAGSARAVAFVLERAEAPGVKNAGAMAAKLIRDGERPPASWRPKAERAAIPTHSAALGDRGHQAAVHRSNAARRDAELALIARHPDIADAAAAEFIAAGGPFAELVASKPHSERRTHARAREAVLAAIVAQTGETAHPEAGNHARPKRARELTA